MGSSTLLLLTLENFGLILICDDAGIEALTQFQVLEFFFLNCWVLMFVLLVMLQVMVYLHKHF